MTSASLSSPFPRRRAAAHATPGLEDAAEQAIQVVLAMLREQTGMDVVFVRDVREGSRRFRIVDALGHGPAAALATASAPAADLGMLLEAPVVLRDGTVHGHLCGHAPHQEAASAERRLRALRHGAQLAARLLENEKVLRQLSRQAL